MSCSEAVLAQQCSHREEGGCSWVDVVDHGYWTREWDAGLPLGVACVRPCEWTATRAREDGGLVVG